MDWLAQNWVWVLVFAAFIGMHLFGHGGHGGHDGHGSHGGGSDQRPADGEQSSGEQPGKNRPQGHHH